MVLYPGSLSLAKANFDSFARVIRETWLFRHILVQVVAEEVGALIASMTVINAKEGTHWPRRVLSFCRALHKSQLLASIANSEMKTNLQCSCVALALKYSR